MARQLSLISIGILWLASAAAGDTFHLRSGGQVEGQLLNAEESPRRTYQIRLDSGGDVTLDTAEVEKVVVLTPAQRQYRDLLKRMPSDTAEMHWKMSEACFKWKLYRERQFHLERAIELDPDHKEARQALKYKQQADGSWARIEDIKAAAGLIRWDGKWMTPAQAKLAEAEEKREEAEVAWKKKLRMWRGWLKDSRRRGKAISEIESIQDPLAAKPLVEMFWSERNIALRQLIADVLAQLDSGLATSALAQAAMQGDNEDDNEIRLYAIKLLERHNLRGVVPAFLPELNSSSNVRVRRAAHVIGQLGDETVVLPLIKALRTKHTQLVGGAGNGNINVSRGGLSVGRTKPKKVDVWRENREVLSALVKLTDQDFEYDQQRWLNWYLSLTTPPGLDLRRDP